MKNRILYTFLFLISFFHALGQDIRSHQWNERVLIVLTTDATSELYKKQLQVFKNTLSGIEERKLKIYLAAPSGYKVFGTDDEIWKPNNDLFSTVKQKDSELELVLIGLDGGIKHRTYTLTSAQEIFDVIDGMPIRKSEMKRKQN